MSEGTGNTGYIATPIPESPETSPALTDVLPPTLRALIKAAPYDYAVAPYFDEWVELRDTVEPARIAQMWGRQMMADRARDALHLYGPTHPQAARRKAAA